MSKNSGLEQFKLPRWEELPSVDLYLDQVLSLLDEWLGDYLNFDGKKVMTKTMINNYVKLKFIESPVKKRYDRKAVASLFVIAILKSVYTINEIARLIRLAIRTIEPEAAYNQFCQMIEEAVELTFKGEALPKNDFCQDPRGILRNVSNSFAGQLYVRHVYLQADETDEDEEADEKEE